jgi:hypothetical protein
VNRSSKPTPRWTRWVEAPAVVCHPPYLRRTLGIAGLVGTVLFAINHLDVVLEGRATTRTWVKTLLTYLVPFCVSNYGLLVGTREPRSATDISTEGKHAGLSDSSEAGVHDPSEVESEDV